MATDVVHHLYSNGPDKDLVPYCGAIPGPDPVTGVWHTGHDRDVLIEFISSGAVGCVTCLSPKALGGWTQLIFDEDQRSDRP